MAKTKEQILQEAMARQQSNADLVASQMLAIGNQPSRQQILSQAMSNATPAQRYQQSIKEDPLTSALYSIPGTRPLMEFANAAGRSSADIVDFFGPDAINSILQISGSDFRVPTLRGALENVGALAPAGSYMQPGTPQQLVTTAGQIPAAMTGPAFFRRLARESAAVAPNVANVALGVTRQSAPLVAPTTGQRVVQTLASTTPKQDIIAATGATVGAEAGKYSGIPGAEFVGSIVGGVGAIPLIRNMNQALTNTNDFKQMAGNLSRVRTDIAAEMLAKSLNASGMSIDDAMAQYRSLGPNALPADIDQSFREILRTAMNVSEGVSGLARRTVNQRQAGSGQRIGQALDIISTDNVDDYLASIDQVLSPQVRALYDKAAQNPVSMPATLRAMFEGDSAIARAQPDVQKSLSDRRAMGEKISNFDLIDETKHALDDQIGAALRNGKNQEARRMIRLRNYMVGVADSQIPEYSQAREMYAGRMAISDAAALGETIFQTNARELRELTSVMTQHERNAYILAAKDAILNRIDNTGMTRNQSQALFGKNGDAMKLATLFTDDRSRRRFMDSLRRESEFVATRNAVLGNSTTAQQLQRIKESLAPAGGYKQRIGQAAALVSNPTQIAGQVADIIDNINAAKGSDLYLKGLVEAGEILLTSGMNASTLQRLLETGNVDRLTTELRKVAAPNYSGRAAAVMGIGSQQATQE